MNYTIGPISYGWSCPKCGRVYSPTQEMCLYCGGDKSDQPSNGTKSPITIAILNEVANLSDCPIEGSGVDTSISK